ncbi:MAG TPA: plasmid pRiA4b ORF-3 family protein [Methylococcaceae bacterium]|jgi:hypothetical protein|nr:plasmid pRiA4b ORF-3 family protein [Methylococcaceae bacterium]
MKTKPGTSIYQLKVSLQGSKPPIWRRLLVAADITLPKLHDILQISMGWTDSHLHSFRTGNEYFGQPDGDFPSAMKSEARVKLNSLLQREKDSVIYEYDFGDSWEHRIVLEKILPFDEQVKLPRCTAGKRACPPEDCGGIWGYSDLLDTLQDPQHPDHDEMKEWLGGDFDPEFFDMAGVNKMLAQL